MSDRRSETIRSLREHASVTDIALLIHDACLQRLCRVWSKVTIRTDNDQLGEATDIDDISVGLQWQNVILDIEEIGAMARIPRPLVRAYVTQGKLLQLIYADGSINPQAQRFLDSVFAQDLVRTGVANQPAGRRPVQPETPPVTRSRRRY